MGADQSMYDSGQYSALPVSGLNPENGLFVIFTPDNRFIRPTETVLTLKEKYSSWTGDDCVIKDFNNAKWFDINAPMLSSFGPTIRILSDNFGQEVCQYQMKTFTMHGTAYVTVQTPSGRWCVATIKRQGGQGLFANNCNADIFIHNPMQALENLASTDGVTPTIHVGGDFMAKNYDFMKNVGIINGNQVQLIKIAQVVRQWGPTTTNYPNTYFLRIGPNVDIAFICICAYALDELFSDDTPAPQHHNRRCYEHNRLNCPASYCRRRYDGGHYHDRCYEHDRINCDWPACRRWHGGSGGYHDRPYDDYRSTYRQRCYEHDRMHCDYPSCNGMQKRCHRHGEMDCCSPFCNEIPIPDIR